MSLALNVVSLHYNVVPVILTILVGVFTWFLWRRRLPSSPPGTNGLPLLGVIPWMGKYLEKTLTEWSKMYGPIYMVKFGNADVLVLNSPDAVYEAFAKKEGFADRPQTISALEGGYGILLINKTDFHKEQRRFGLNTLRELGMGRRSLEPQLIELSIQFCEKIETFCDQSGTSKPFLIHRLIYELVSSVISCIVFGHAVSNDNEDFRKVVTALMDVDSSAFLTAILMLVPSLKHFPVFSSQHKKGEEFQHNIHAAIRNEVTIHKTSRDRNDPRDFIDYFLDAIEHSDEAIGDKDRKSGLDGLMRSANIENPVDDEEEEDFSKDWTPGLSFQEDQLVGTVRDLFLAGTDTTATSVLWIILYLLKYPDVQTKMQNEIMSMKEKLPYVRAVIEEVTRLRPASPLAVPHLASRDDTLMNYQIPKGTIIVSNLWAIQHNENRWPNPDKFLPERHLDGQGKFKSSDHWVIFGLGRRSCLGQQLAKMEMFINTVCLFRRFNFRFPTGYQADMTGNSFINLRPKDFEVVVSLR